MIIVLNKTTAHYLRGTVWTSDKERATRYPTVVEASAALATAAKFNPKGAKGATFIPAE